MPVGNVSSVFPGAFLILSPLSIHPFICQSTMYISFFLSHLRGFQWAIEKDLESFNRALSYHNAVSHLCVTPSPPSLPLPSLSPSHFVSVVTQPIGAHFNDSPSWLGITYTPRVLCSMCTRVFDCLHQPSSHSPRQIISLPRPRRKLTCLSHGHGRLSNRNFDW